MCICEVALELLGELALAAGRARTMARRSRQRRRAAAHHVSPGREEPREDAGRPLPLAGFLLELLPAGARQR